MRWTRRAPRSSTITERDSASRAGPGSPTPSVAPLWRATYAAPMRSAPHPPPTSSATHGVAKGRASDDELGGAARHESAHSVRRQGNADGDAHPRRGEG